jgi:hypothetical protein
MVDLNDFKEQIAKGDIITCVSVVAYQNIAVAPLLTTRTPLLSSPEQCRGLHSILVWSVSGD